MEQVESLVRIAASRLRCRRYLWVKPDASDQVVSQRIEILVSRQEDGIGRCGSGSDPRVVVAYFAPDRYQEAVDLCIALQHRLTPYIDDHHFLDKLLELIYLVGAPPSLGCKGREPAVLCLSRSSLPATRVRWSAGKLRRSFRSD